MTLVDRLAAGATTELDPSWSFQNHTTTFGTDPSGTRGPYSLEMPRKTSSRQQCGASRPGFILPKPGQENERDRFVVIPTKSATETSSDRAREHAIQLWPCGEEGLSHHQLSEATVFRFAARIEAAAGGSVLLAPSQLKPRGGQNVRIGS